METDTFLVNVRKAQGESVMIILEMKWVGGTKAMRFVLNFSGP